MKKLTNILLVVAVTAMLAGCSLSYQIPTNYMPVDLDGDGSPDAAVADADANGVPDIDADGNYIVDAESIAHFKAVSTVDSTIGMTGDLLELLGMIGLPIVGGVGLLINRNRKRIKNLIVGAAQSLGTTESVVKQIVAAVQSRDLVLFTKLVTQELNTNDPNSIFQQVNGLLAEGVSLSNEMVAVLFPEKEGAAD